MKLTNKFNYKNSKQQKNAKQFSTPTNKKYLLDLLILNNIIQLMN
jgi:hypothetical protein